MKDRELNEYRNKMIDNGIATGDEIDLVCSIIGENKRTLDRIIYARTNCDDLEHYISTNR